MPLCTTKFAAGRLACPRKRGHGTQFGFCRQDAGGTFAGTARPTKTIGVYFFTLIYRIGTTMIPL